MLAQALGYVSTLANKRRNTRALSRSIGLSIAPDLLTGCLISQVSENASPEISSESPQSRRIVELFSFEHPFTTEVKQEIHSYVRKNHFENTPVSLVLGSSDYQFFLMEDLLLDDKTDKQEAVRWKLVEFLDYSAEDAIIDYIELPHKAQTKSSRMIYAIATPKVTIHQYVDWARDCGFYLQHIDIWQHVVGTVIAKHQDLMGSIVVKLVENKMEILIVKEGIIYLMRQIELPYLILQAKMGQDVPPDVYESICIEIQRSIDYCASVICTPNVMHILIDPTTDRILMLSMIEKLTGLKASYLGSEQAAELADPNINIQQHLISYYGASKALYEAGD